jgi:hypothetical protein
VYVAREQSLSVQYYLQRSLAAGTQRTYSAAEIAYRDYCESRGWPRDAPIRADSAAEWLTSLAAQGQHNASTIAVYKSALRTAAELEVPFGTSAANPLDDPKIKRLLTGIAADRAELEQLHRRAHPQAAPLTFDVLRGIAARYAGDARGRMHYAALTLAVTSAARPSEIFGSARYPERALRARQVRFYADAAGQVELLAGTPTVASPHHLELELDVSKTDQRRVGAVKIISAPSAVAAMWTHCCEHGAKGEESLFAMGGRQLTANAVLVRLRRELTDAGQGTLASTLTARSFRRGGASTLSATGIDDADIARLGWATSSTVGRTHYANDPRVQRARALTINAQMESAASIGSSL